MLQVPALPGAFTRVLVTFRSCFTRSGARCAGWTAKNAEGEMTWVGVSLDAVLCGR
jgi:hypothetical protein